MITVNAALLFAAPDIGARLSAVEAAAKNAQSAGDNAWMLVSAALVLMMTGPGLALFYGGLVRRKNVLSTMMHSFALMALITVIWAMAARRFKSSAVYWPRARGPSTSSASSCPSCIKAWAAAPPRNCNCRRGGSGGADWMEGGAE